MARRRGRVTDYVIGTLPATRVTVRTIDPLSYECAPNSGLLGTEGHRFLWSFGRGSAPLEFSSGEGPLLDLGARDAVDAVISEIVESLRTESALDDEGERGLEAVLSVLRRTRETDVSRSGVR